MLRSAPGNDLDLLVNSLNDFLVFLGNGICRSISEGLSYIHFSGQFHKVLPSDDAVLLVIELVLSDDVGLESNAFGSLYAVSCAHSDLDV